MGVHWFKWYCFCCLFVWISCVLRWWRLVLFCCFLFPIKHCIYSVKVSILIIYYIYIQLFSQIELFSELFSTFTELFSKNRIIQWIFQMHLKNSLKFTALAASAIVTMFHFWSTIHPCDQICWNVDFHHDEGITNRQLSHISTIWPTTPYYYVRISKYNQNRAPFINMVHRALIFPFHIWWSVLWRIILIVFTIAGICIQLQTIQMERPYFWPHFVMINHNQYA